MDVQVSIENVVCRVRNTNGGWIKYVGILDPEAYTRGVMRWRAIGGAARLTPLGVSFLEGAFGAREFLQDESHTYAQFIVDEDRVEGVLTIFANLERGNDYEFPAAEDIRQKLREKHVEGMAPVLIPARTGEVGVRYLSTLRQPPLSASGVRRLFRLHELTVFPDMEVCLLKSPLLRTLTVPELATTCGGSRMGETQDGEEIASDLFLS